MVESSWVVEWLLMAADGHVIELALRPGRCLTVGRDLTSDVPLLDAGISRHHALLSLEGGSGPSQPMELWVEDLHSQNGIFVNTVRVHRVRLQEGDIITFGRIQLTVVIRRRRKDRGGELLRPLSSRDVGRLLEISRRMHTAREPAIILQLGLDELFSTIRAERGAILLWDPRRTELRPVVTCPHEGFHELKSISAMTTTTQTIIENGWAQVEPRGHSRMGSLEGLDSPRATAPLFAGDEPVGMVYVDRSPGARPFTKPENRFLAAFSWIIEAIVEWPGAAELSGLVASPGQDQEPLPARTSKPRLPRIS